MKYFVLAILSLIIVGCHHNHPKANKIPQAQTARQSRRHPYGNPVSGSLWWENDGHFRKMRANHGATVRMAAFQTTLPDPLPGEEHNVALGADLLAGKIVVPGGIFSMNRAIGPYTGERGFRQGPYYAGAQVRRTIGGGVCKIATTLYNVTVLANLPIVERRAHGMLVPYVPPGQDATVSYGLLDFKFKNDTGHPILIWADTRGKTLYIAFYGRRKPPRVRWGHKILSRQKPPVIRRDNKKMSLGEEEIKTPGADGMAVKSWLQIEYPDGRQVRKDLGIDCYRPMPRVVERG